MHKCTSSANAIAVVLVSLASLLGANFAAPFFIATGTGGPSQEDIARETDGLGLGQDTVAGAPGVQVAAAMGGGTFSPNSYGMPGHDVNFASDIYMGPGYGGGCGRRHCFGGGRRLQRIIPGNDWKR